MDSRGPAPPPPGFFPPPGAPVEMQPMGMPTPMMPPNPGYPPPPATVVPPYGAGDHMQPQPPPPPTTGGWSQQNPTCPSGLEYLMPLDNLFVNQKVELLEAFVGWETQNKYSVVNIRGDTVYHVVEESGIIGRMCMGSHRACEFHVFDMNRREVLRMTRPLRCSSCCCFCCLQELQVYSGQTLLGSVVQDWSLWRPSFTIRDNLDNEVLCIKGPWLRYCFDVSFEIRSLDNEHRVGIIAKRWSGLAREFFTDTDVFGMNFPLDLDVKIKAVLLGACLLIDFMYFESSGKQV